MTRPTAHWSKNGVQVWSLAKDELRRCLGSSLLLTMNPTFDLGVAPKWQLIKGHMIHHNLQLIRLLTVTRSVLCFVHSSATTHSKLIVAPHAAYRDLLPWPSEIQYIVQRQFRKVVESKLIVNSNGKKNLEI